MPSDSKIHRIRRPDLLLLVVTVCGHAFKHIFNSAFFVMLPEIKQSLALTHVQIGTLSTFRNTVGGFSNLPAGFAADRFSRLRPELLGLSIALTGLSVLFVSSATGYWSAVVGATLWSVFISLWHPAAIASLSQTFVNRRGFAIALHGSGGSVGEVIGPLSAGILMAIFKWRTVLRGSVLPALVVGTLVWIALTTIPRIPSSIGGLMNFGNALATIFRNRKLLLIFLFAGGFAAAQTVILTFLPIYLREDLGASTITLGVYLSLAQVAGIGTQPIMGYLSDKLGRRAVLAPSLLLLALAFLGLNLSPTGWPLILAIIMMGAFLFPPMAILLAAAMDVIEPEIHATTTSLVFGTAILFSGISPTAAGWLSHAFGVRSSFLLAAAIALTTGLIAGTTSWQNNSGPNTTDSHNTILSQHPNSPEP